MSNIDKRWLRAPRASTAYASGVDVFLNFAAENAGMLSRVLCPCKNCANRFWLTPDLVSEHLICDGFMCGYTYWYYHGENNEPPTEHACASDDTEPAELAHTDEMDRMLLDNFGMYDTGSLRQDRASRVRMARVMMRIVTKM